MNKKLQKSTLPKPSYLSFNKKKYIWKKTINYRLNPNKYRVGRGEQGVLICEPYKTEIIAYWRFKTPAEALKSAKKILSLFRRYLKNNDFVGADLSRKFLQMGFTRSRRYANYRGGIKYDKEKNYTPLEKGSGDPEKIKSAKVFYEAWQLAESNTKYTKLKKAWKEELG
jgi:hypothetical protein